MQAALPQLVWHRLQAVALNHFLLMAVGAGMGQVLQAEVVVVVVVNWG
jgi:hypothetical protein